MDEGEKSNSEVFKHKYQCMNIDELKELMKSETISKNQKKKISKKIRWIEDTDNRRAIRKIKKKEQKAKKRKLGPNDETIAQLPKRRKHTNISTTENFESNYHIAIDCSFEDHMTNDDLRKLTKQIAWCYQENRKAVKPVQYHLCGLQERTTNGMDSSYKNWDLHFHQNVYEAFKNENIVYLTAESDNVLDTMAKGTVYVIGGLVDHNLLKGMCHKLAVEKKVKTARLPLSEYIQLQTRKVLTINHVFEILLKYRETEDWKTSIVDILPKRKGVKMLKNGKE